MYQVANINLLHIFRDRNIAVFYECVVMETGARSAGWGVGRGRGEGGGEGEGRITRRTYGLMETL